MDERIFFFDSQLMSSSNLVLARILFILLLVYAHMHFFAWIYYVKKFNNLSGK